MTSKKFKLNINNNNPFPIQLFEKQKETHILIRLTKGAYCDSLNLLTLENETFSPKNLPAVALRILPLPGYPQISINANFNSPKGFIDVEVYKGHWEEMLLAEIEFSFSASPYSIACDHDQLAFTIGEKDQSHVEVKANPDGGFDTVFTIHKGEGEILNSDYFFEEDSEAAQTIKRLYGRIKGRVKGDGFAERQNSYKDEYTKNLNKIMSETYQA